MEQPDGEVSGDDGEDESKGDARQRVEQDAVLEGGIAGNRKAGRTGRKERGKLRVLISQTRTYQPLLRCGLGSSSTI
jgi:hypothetical protein